MPSCLCEHGAERRAGARRGAAIAFVLQTLSRENIKALLALFITKGLPSSAGYEGTLEDKRLLRIARELTGVPDKVLSLYQFALSLFVLAVCSILS